ncbi:DUF192 domain-containing protein [Sulfobacillus harzensis]|uniref:DUF192 domain-containing protein n=1 Tax=Sulfobacillus harzensis TaxID=2729629 RepID=A0A7Y0L7K7_9FIRM|nr:DUF192 domain-containing protein [Sulfobacillus harzensis]NMP24442.1 DUF192 domain-containing protein [Sulfobacillus harzensis]
MTYLNVHTADGIELGSHVRLTQNPWHRFLGLMGTRNLGMGQGMLFPHTNAVHGFFMRYAIRLVYLTRDQRILRTALLKPWRLGPWVRDAYYVLELPISIEGEALKPGTRISWSRATP